MSSIRMSPLLRSRVATASGSRTSIRSAHDLIIQGGASKKPVVKYGPHTGGRSAVSGHVATVFGCTGFLGRYVVSKLAKAGTQVIVPYRNEDEKRHLRVMGDLGQIVPMEWDARNAQQIEECLKHSDTVYNLVGRDWETRNFSYEDVNVTAPGLIAEVAAANNTPRLIHLSHLNASPDSTSAFYRSKYAGEKAVRKAFPDATIVRPAALFGPEDWLLNGIAQYPILYKLNHGATKILPAHVMDVAQALTVMLTSPVASVGQTFSLPGPGLHTYASLEALVSALTLKPVSSAPVLPKPVAMLLANIFNRAMWWPTISPDEVERKYIDDFGVDAFEAAKGEIRPAGWGAASLSNTGKTGVDGEPVRSWADLGIEPETIEEHAIKYLRRYRSAETFTHPVEMGNIKRPKQYHVIE